MTIKNRLKNLSEKTIDDVKIELKLYNLADDLEKKARNHLKRIMSVLSEFDIHDEHHSEKVIYNIEQLLGEETINHLSCYELFLLQLAAFFHDCAMAPSDWEINTLKMTEGGSKFFIDKDSLKKDLEPLTKLSEAQIIIKERKASLYGKFEGDVQEWLFSSQTEDQLINYLGELLIDYQNHRNGFADELRKVKNIEEFKILNHFIRVDYIRATHHIRIETYIRNLEKIFAGAFEQPAWGKQLAQDLAKICRSHGEDVNFIIDFSKDTQYYGAIGANIQFVAIMLRLGDIIHFSYDRAPIELRSSRIFKSEYSFQQWAIKNNGVNYSIENGQISFRAYCDVADTYFKLHQYIDWIELEIQHYFKFQRQWQKNYVPNLQDKVNRDNINYDENNFLPRRGLSFSLNQNKIIELLMGVGLYKNRAASLRELYQNSLDACKCMLAQSAAIGGPQQGNIRFGITQEYGQTFLFCLDNGIGMSKEVIEQYLLKIGNSYYKSSDFFKLQANWSGKFTPTSQFGIGILSCFMIGDKIEITTKTITGDFISCSIDGPHENFYYKQTHLLDKESIQASGTLVKIQLNPEYINLFSDIPIDKIGMVLFGIDAHLPEQFEEYLGLRKIFENHLYNKLNQFIEVVPKNIKVEVQLADSTIVEILSKPILLDINNANLNLTEKDFEVIDYQNDFRKYFPEEQRSVQASDFLECYPIEITSQNITFHSFLTLPKKTFDFKDIRALYKFPKIGAHGLCIDGIRSEKSSLGNLDHYYSGELMQMGLLNFTGELRPQLSVDRTSVVNYPEEFEEIAKEITKALLEKILELTHLHIEKYAYEIDSIEFDLIWEYIFDYIDFADVLFINELAATSYGQIQWKGLTNVLLENQTISQFLLSQEVEIKDWYLATKDTLTKKLILTKMISATNIQVSENKLTIQSNGVLKNDIVKKKRSFSEYDFLIKADSWDVSDRDFDIISNLYPMVPAKLFDLVKGPDKQNIYGRIKIMHAYSNHFPAMYGQSALLIHEKLGLYLSDRDLFSRKKSQVYLFSTKRAPINLFELTGRYRQGQSVEKEYVLLAYIAPDILTSDDQKEIEKYRDSDPGYVQGVTEGWSLLITGKDEDNIVIKPGKHSRESLVRSLSPDFWECNSSADFQFTDGTKMCNLNN